MKYIDMRILYVVFVVFFISCNRVDIVIKKLYANGSIKESLHYHDKSDTTAYLKVAYLTDGTVKDSLFYNIAGRLDGLCYSCDSIDSAVYRKTYVNGIRNGYAEKILFNGERSIVNFRNDTIDCVERKYNAKNDLIEKTILVKNKPLLVKSLELFYPGDTVFEFRQKRFFNQEKLQPVYIATDTVACWMYNEIDNDFNLKLIGCVEYDMSKKQPVRNSNYNNYTYSHVDDSVVLGEPHKMTVETFWPKSLNTKGFRGVVYIGKFDEELDFNVV